jgi:hypothetical protein
MDMGKPKPAGGPANITILGGNPVIGKALEALLASTDYVARFFAEYPEGDAEPLGGAQVALVLPAPSSRHQEALIAMIRNTPSTTNLPVIELITTPNENGHGIMALQHRRPAAVYRRDAARRQLVSTSARRLQRLVSQSARTLARESRISLVYAVNT